MKDKHVLQVYGNRCLMAVKEYIDGLNHETSYALTVVEDGDAPVDIEFTDGPAPTPIGIEWKDQQAPGPQLVPEAWEEEDLLVDADEGDSPLIRNYLITLEALAVNEEAAGSFIHDRSRK